MQCKVSHRLNATAIVIQTIKLSKKQCMPYTQMGFTFGPIAPGWWCANLVRHFP